MSYPDPEIAITELQLKNMLDRQFPEFSNLKLQLIASGWDNFIYRFGTDLMIRIPRRQLGAELIGNEIVWLQRLNGQLPIDIPVPIRVGKPNNHYPWRWTIMPWFDGKSALNTVLERPQVKRFISFLKTLHSLAHKNAPANPFRDVPLSMRDKDVQKKISELESKSISIPKSIQQQWKTITNIEIDTPPCLIHGDLHPGNIIVNNNKLQAIIDWGDITKGDPATDLASLWMLIENPEQRIEAFNEYGASGKTIQRSKGWAILYGVTFLNTGMEKYRNLGKRILNNINGF